MLMWWAFSILICVFCGICKGVDILRGVGFGIGYCMLGFLGTRFEAIMDFCMNFGHYVIVDM